MTSPISTDDRRHFIAFTAAQPTSIIKSLTAEDLALVLRILNASPGIPAVTESDLTALLTRISTTAPLISHSAQSAGQNALLPPTAIPATPSEVMPLAAEVIRALQKAISLPNSAPKSPSASQARALRAAQEVFDSYPLPTDSDRENLIYGLAYLESYAHSSFIIRIFRTAINAFYNFFNWLFGFDKSIRNFPFALLNQGLAPCDLSPALKNRLLDVIDHDLLNHQNPLPPAGNRAGIPNLQNTCYLNSIIQLIASSNYFNEALNTPIEAHLPNTLRIQLRGIISKVREGTIPTLKDLQLFYLLLRLNGYTYPPTEQGDADDIFTFLADKIPLFPESTITDSITAETGGDVFIPTTTLRYPSLQIAIPHKQSNPPHLRLQNLVDQYFEIEEVGNRRKKMALTGDLPPLITFHLKRLFTDETGSIRYAGVINVMEEIVINGVRYRPKSFTLHTGSSIGGHYRNISVQADGRLVLADDWSTREAPLKTPKYTELIDTDVNKNATLCIYERTPLP